MWRGVKEGVQAIAVVVVVVAGAYAIDRVALTDEEDLAGHRVVAGDRVQPVAVVTGMVGTVEVVRGDMREPARVGARVVEDETLSTGMDGRVDLDVDGNSRITLTESSDLAVREITDAVHRFKLRQGRVAVEYRAAGERVLKIESRLGDTVAETQAARFSVLSTTSTFVVAAASGRVDLSAQGVTVRVAAGEHAIAHAGQPPGAPTPIPTHLLLRVAKKHSAAANRCAVVEGKAEPGTEISVDGEVVAVQSDGTFRVPLERRASDPREVRIRGRGVTGLVEERVIPCQAVGAPIRDFSIRWQSESGAD